MNNKIIFLSAILFSALASAQVKIGGTDGIPNPNAMLEVEATNKGILLPRVELSSTTLPAPLTGHVQGMTVYNTVTTGDVVPGQYYNDGTKWNRIANSTDISAVITANNGLTKTGNNIALGGSLTAPTTITTTPANTLNITGLPATTTAQLATDKIIVQDATGALKTANASDFAKSVNNTVYSASKDGAWSLLNLNIAGQNWQKISLTGTDTKVGNNALFTNGVYTAPSAGVYIIKYEFQLKAGVDLGLLGDKKLVIIKNTNQLLEEKLFDGVRVSLLGIGLVQVPVTSTTMDTMVQLNTNETITFGVDSGGINLGLLTDGKISLYVHKISDL
ncbi:hypothetical protein MG290_10045 [Flavobacterium sp. CBA20B-1]|uniref:hypothetical protein n=1 Tax=unclassified Flavobacterium TaxID=196869 RepID=UPI00222562F3|nr:MULTISPECIES: hypothetical protein [unclassified Flavobacterium]WCM41297.1 hypothetical protein MG290_10045 [Flavobacterium sp. CBA20B-1]